jgi:hypothetical protein bacD2_03092
MKLKETRIGKPIRAWYYKVYKNKRNIKRRSDRILGQYYSPKNPKIGVSEHTLIAMLDGKTVHGGLADRFRGILSIYELCRQKGVPFKIYFRSPFTLENYLIPNEYDWRVSDEEMSYNSNEATPSFLIDGGQETEEYLINIINSKRKRQEHIYSNTPSVFKNGNYSILFNELFKANDKLDAEILKYKKDLSPHDISISTRFMNLLGDFNERDSLQLSEDEQSRLINACVAQIVILHNEYPDHRVFVASDSYKFLCSADKLDYVTISGGKPIHIDNCDADSAKDSQLKTFIDFLLISEADHIFMLHSGQMYIGNFAYSASLVNNRHYKLIDF